MSDRRLTEEIRKKLIGLNPFNQKSTIDFTPTFYKKKNEDGDYNIPQEYWPVFSVRPYTQGELLDIRKVYANKNTENIKLDSIRNFARVVTMGWSSLFDSGTMEEIDYTKDQDGFASKEIFESFSFNLINSIIAKATQISGLSSEEAEGLE